MRSRSIRLSIGILLLLGIAIALLGFRTIHIDVPGFPEINRDGAGPLGLKLGLDLSGGGHLVFQADTGTRFDVTFQDPVDFSVLETTLSELRFGEDDLPLEDLQVIPRDLQFVQQEEPPVEEVAPAEEGAPAEEATAEGDAPEAGAGEAEVDTTGEGEDAEDQAPINLRIIGLLTQVQIRTDILSGEDPRSTGLRSALEAEFGAITDFRAVDIDAPTSDQMRGVKDNIEQRVNRFGTEEPIIQIFGDDRIIVQLPGASGSSSQIFFSEPQIGPDAFATVRAALESAGWQELEIKRDDEQTFSVTSSTVGSTKQTDAETALNDQLGPVQISVSSAIDDAKALIGTTARLEFRERTCANEACVEFTEGDVILTGDDLIRAEASTDPVGIGWVVDVQFDGEGSDIFSELTSRISTPEGQLTKRIAIYMDDAELLAPRALAHIRDGRTQISGNFNREEAQTFAIQLESGRLPVPLRLIQESDVDALLGSDSLRNSLIAGLVGLGLVLTFMIFYYRMAGVVAAVALTFYTIMVLAIFKLFNITLELAHIGGFILSIGMAVDANILIFERMKEEVRIGRTLASSMEVGFSRAWPAIRDSNISTMITCGVLLWFGDRLGGGLVTGVAISLFIGVAVSMFTAVVVSRNVLQLMAFVGLGGRINLFTPEPVQRGGAPVGPSGGPPGGAPGGRAAGQAAGGSR